LFFGKRDPDADFGGPKEIVFSADREGAKYLREGWSKVEAWGVWSSGDVSRITLLPRTGGQWQPSKLRLAMRRLPLSLDTRQVLTITVGDRSTTVDLHRQTRRDFWVELDLPSSSAGEIDITLKVTPNYQLNEVDAKLNDKRSVGIGLLRAVIV
jgi:hypothetical protein